MLGVPAVWTDIDPEVGCWLKRFASAAADRRQPHPNRLGGQEGAAVEGVPTNQSLVDHVKQVLPRCLTPNQRPSGLPPFVGTGARPV